MLLVQFRSTSTRSCTRRSVHTGLVRYDLANDDPNRSTIDTELCGWHPIHHAVRDRTS